MTLCYLGGIEGLKNGLKSDVFDGRPYIHGKFRSTYVWLPVSCFSPLNLKTKGGTHEEEI